MLTVGNTGCIKKNIFLLQLIKNIKNLFLNTMSVEYCYIKKLLNLITTPAFLYGSLVKHFASLHSVIYLIVQNYIEEKT